MLEPAVADQPAAAFLRIGGSTVAGHQLAAVLATGARKVIALARGASPPVIALQHEAERNGVAFRIATNAHDLAALVTAQDEMLVLAEGLFAGRGALPGFDGADHAVLAQPVEQGIAGGFERLDINHAAAGVALVPGRLAERLLELPSDSDAGSALVRIALQSGVPMRQIDGRGQWRLVRSDDEAAVAEREWMRAQFGERVPAAPGHWLARAAALRLGPDLLHQGKGAGTLLVAAGIVLLLSGGAGWFGQTTLGLALLAVAWLLVAATGPLRRLAGGTEGAALPERAASWAIDVLFIALVIWRAPLAGWDEAAARGFAPLVLVGLLRLVAPLVAPAHRQWLEDRALLAVSLMAACLAGYLPQTVAVFVLALLATGLSSRPAAANATLTMPR